MKRGDPVIYLLHPRLYGEMEVAEIDRNGRVLCIVDPDSKHPGLDWFDVHEIEVAVAAAA